jgi:hypothetical protein
MIFPPPENDESRDGLQTVSMRITAGNAISSITRTASRAPGAVIFSLAAFACAA